MLMSSLSVDEMVLQRLLGVLHLFDVVTVDAVVQERQQGALGHSVALVQAAQVVVVSAQLAVHFCPPGLQGVQPLVLFGVGGLGGLDGLDDLLHGVGDQHEGRSPREDVRPEGGRCDVLHGGVFLLCCDDGGHPQPRQAGDLCLCVAFVPVGSRLYPVQLGGRVGALWGLVVDGQRPQDSAGDGLTHADPLRLGVDDRQVGAVHEGALHDHGRGLGVADEGVVVAAGRVGAGLGPSGLLPQLRDLGQDIDRQGHACPAALGVVDLGPVASSGVVVDVHGQVRGEGVALRHLLGHGVVLVFGAAVLHRHASGGQVGPAGLGDGQVQVFLFLLVAGGGAGISATVPRSDEYLFQGGSAPLIRYRNRNEDNAVYL